MKNNFDVLYDETKNHLEHKKYLYRAVKKKNGKIVKRNGREVLHPPTAHKTVLLSLAFNIALENYQNIRPHESVKELENITDVSDLLLRYFSNKFYNKIDSLKTNNKLIDNEQNYQFLEIEKFKKIEYKLYGTVNRFRNYHSHHIHEPGILTFQDFFKNDQVLSTKDFEEAKEWFLKRFNDAKNHLIKSLKDRKEKLEKQEGLEKENKCKEIDKVLEQFFKKLYFFKADKKTISLDGRLFIASMFLYKRQAKIILEKWRDVKKAEGYENTKYTFFTYYCLSERYSLNNYNDNLLKFRDITSKLSTIPYNTNPNLEFIYEKIRELNEVNYNAIEESENSVSKYMKKCEFNRKTPNEEHLEKLHKTVDNFKQKIMPIRKRHILTQVLLQYILDNNLILEPKSNKDSKKEIPIIKIAIKKTPSDIEAYFEEHKNDLDRKKNLTFLKNKIKSLPKNTEERKRLNEHLKELKRNFIFKTPQQIEELSKPIPIFNKEKTEITGYTPPKGYSFTQKKKNTLLQFEHHSITANITLSPELLLKWVFVHITTGKNCFNNIIHFINEHIERLTNENKDVITTINNFYNNPRNARLKGKIFPKSLHFTDNQSKLITEEYILNHIDNRIENLNTFYNTNFLQPKPWKYESKKKIDTILEYMHFMLVQDVYINNINKNYKEETPEAFIRHKYLNMETYNIAREYFRFFGRYESLTRDVNLQEYTLKIIDGLKKEYALCFGYLNTAIQNSNSLEELFDATIKKQIEALVTLKEKLAETPVETLIKILKINTPSKADNVKKIYKEHFYAKSFALPPALISIEKECPELWNEFKQEKEKKLQGKIFRCSDFSFIRNNLQKDGVTTNIDFILQHIIPKTGIKKIPNSTFKHLLKLKTEELILWAIAKHYWQKANDKAYTFTTAEKDTNNKSYQKYCTFNKVYQRTLDYTITIEPSFWVNKKGNPNKEQERFKRIINTDQEIVNSTLTFTIKVPAKKYDNKFLGVETHLIKEFCLFNCYDAQKQRIILPNNYKHTKTNKEIKYYNLQNYEDLMYVIYSELKNSIDDIKLLLSSEKKIIAKNKNLVTILEKKYRNNEQIKDFYVAFTNNFHKKELKEDIALWEAFITELKPDNEAPEIIKNYLTLYRNFALHYQLQDKVYRKEVKQFLNEFNKTNYTNKKDFDTREK